MDLEKQEEIDMPEEQTKKHHSAKLCPVCKGTGIDKSAHHRYTTGGHDDRSCPRCDGECFIEDELGESQGPEEDDVEQE